MGTAGRCSAASAKTSNDRWRRRHSHGPLVSAKEPTAIRHGAAASSMNCRGRSRYRSFAHQPRRDRLPGREEPPAGVGLSRVEECARRPGLRDRGSALHSGDRGRHAPGSARRCSGHAGQDCGGDRRVSRSAGHQLRWAHSQFQRSHGPVISDRPIRAVFTARRPMLRRPRTPRFDRRQHTLSSIKRRGGRPGPSKGNRACRSSRPWRLRRVWQHPLDGW